MSGQPKLQTYARLDDQNKVVEIRTIEIVDLTVFNGTANDGTLISWINVSKLAAQPQLHWIYNPTTKTFSPPASIPVTTDQALQNLNLLLLQKEALGIFFQASSASTPSLFSSDAAAQAKFNAAWNMANADIWVDGDPFIAMDGTIVPFTKADILLFAPKLAKYIANCTSNYAKLLQLVLNDPSTNISGGWPLNE